MPAPVQPPAPAVRGVQSTAPVPPPSSQRPRAIDAPGIKPDSSSPITRVWPASMTAGVKAAESNQGGGSFGNSARGFSVPPQPLFGKGQAFGTPENHRPLTAATPQFGQVNTGSTQAPVKNIPRVGERSPHAQIFDFGTKVVTIRVGHEPQHKDFTVHENLLSRSPYLMDIRHKMSTYISLPDAQPEAFSIYQQWLYTKGLHTKTTVKEVTFGPFDPSHRDEWTKLTDIYLLGHKLVDTDFQDRVMDGILEWLDETTTSIYDLSVLLENVVQIYIALKDAREDNPLKRLISDTVSLKFTDAMIQKMVTDRKKELPRSLLLDLVSKLSANSSGSLIMSRVSTHPEFREACHYHCHAAGDCYRKK
ncbi:uncharacterized protein N0V89_006587 [Didymosphaeria variabile]|uniref:BTB domain-containing protein n=1 Tax=Didymosphaeria variabile TaxID=1932322 RepID=A0A9W9C9F9_9PLEO|nr:uncharacterized protein N0V89_006587 [Didymosphaeria variabile]KAJ4351248.1 hypothetical protein N0V89_006587 [Didymosphaeria variabile]